MSTSTQEQKGLGLLELPTVKTPPTITPATAKMLVYGPPGVGKTSLGAALNPDATIILATEPGTGGLEAFVLPIDSWETFLRAGKTLAKGGHPFKQAVIDTADELQRMCQEYVQTKLGIQHPSDLEYGKGWDALSREWRRLAGFVQAFGGGVMFTSHEKYEKVEKPVGTVDRAIPSLTGAAAKWLNGFVEFIFYMSFTTDEQGEHRVIHGRPSETHVAKGRFHENPAVAFPSPLVLPNTVDGAAKVLRKAMFDATRPAEPAAATEKDEPAKKPARKTKTTAAAAA